jgi:hypothetical protein
VTCPATSADVETALDAAESAFESMDPLGFDADHRAVLAQTACVTDALEPADIARIHRLDAVAAYLGRDHDAGVASFRAARAADPALTLPEAFAPEGNAMRLWFEESGLGGGSPSIALPVPAGTTMRVDGVAATEVPLDRPVVVQLVTDAGIRWSGRLQSSADWEGFATATGIPGLAVSSCPSTALGLAITLRRGLASYGAMDIAGFTRARELALEQVGCAQEPLSPEIVAQLHVVEALGWYVARDHDRVVAAWRSVRATAPTWKPPPELAPPGNELSRWFEEARNALPSAVEPLAVPPATEARVDGVVGAPRPLERPAVVQLVGAGSTVQWSGYLRPGSPLPAWDAIGRQYQSRRVMLKPMLVASAGGALTAGGLWIAAAEARSRYVDRDDPLPYEDLDRQRALTNGLGVAAEISTAAALGFGVRGVIGVRREPSPP